MSLYVGNLSQSVKLKELQEAFEEYGPCRIKIISTYAFAEFDETRDAEEALTNLQGKSISGKELKLEWSAKSGRNPERKDKIKGCYICGSERHKKINCPDSKERKSSYRDRRRSRSRSERRHRHRSRSRSRSRRKRSRSRDRKRKYSSSDSSSRSKSRTRNRRRSHSR